MSKRIIAALLALVMLLGLTPVLGAEPASAVDEDEPYVTYSIFDVVIPFINMVDCYRTTYTTVGAMQQVNNFKDVYSARDRNRISNVVPDVNNNPDDYYYRFSKSSSGNKICQTLYKHSDPTFSYLMADDGYIQTYGDNCFIFASGNNGYYGTFVSFREKDYHKCSSNCHRQNYPHDDPSSLDSDRKPCILCGCGDTFVIKGYMPDMEELENLPMTEGLVQIDHNHRYSRIGKCPCGNFEQIAELDKSAAGVYENVATEGLDALLEAHTSETSAIRVFLEVKEEIDDQAEKDAIIDEVGNKKLDFIELSLLKSIGRAEPENIGDDNEVMLTVKIPYSTYGKKNISLYRYHGQEVERLTSTPNENGEYFYLSGGELILNATKFSAYAIAYEEIEMQREDMNYSFSVEPTFTVTIPTDVELGKTLTVSAESVVLGFDEYVDVSISATSGKKGAFTLENEYGDTITYAVRKNGDDVLLGDSVLSVYPGTQSSGSAELEFTAPIDLKYPGEYEGTLVFTVSVKTVQNN